ncbi:MAG TPA: uroporphyrinogen-III synthase [Rhodanobacteraceae bacterium]|nr:uroporphyrinogen-III synthase [Rhodanobacteraceae bacterium]
MTRSLPLTGTRIAITRPSGTAGSLAQRVRALGGTPLLLPGSSLRAPADVETARKALRTALSSDIAIFISPAAVRFARRLGALRGRAVILAPGAGTQRALRRVGRTDAIAPAREDSEGLLAMPALQHVQGRRIGVVGAAGGRGLLDGELGRRGAEIVHAHVYRRLPARLDRRHADALRRTAHEPLYVLLSSVEALANLLGGLSAEVRPTLLGGAAVTSSERLATAARGAGFARVLQADSAHTNDMLAAVVKGQARDGRGNPQQPKPTHSGVRPRKRSDQG